MIHVRDVIKLSLYRADQKPFTDHSSEMTHFMIFSKQYYVIFIQKECCYCFEISKKVSDGQEMTRRSKLLYRPYAGSENEKVTNFLLDGIFT